MTEEMQMFLHLLYPPAFQLFPEMIHSENHLSVMNTLTTVIFHLKGFQSSYMIPKSGLMAKK
jgi:hypothetical protein